MQLIRQCRRYDQKERNEKKQRRIHDILYYIIPGYMFRFRYWRDTRRASSYHQIKSIDQQSRNTLNQENKIARCNLCIYAQTSVEHLNCQRIIKETLKNVRTELENRLYCCLAQNFENIL
jgi:hypothetical protein